VTEPTGYDARKAYYLSLTEDRSPEVLAEARAYAAAPRKDRS
jgi:hypothetical protein